MAKMHPGANCLRCLDLAPTRLEVRLASCGLCATAGRGPADTAASALGAQLRPSCSTEREAGPTPPKRDRARRVTPVASSVLVGIAHERDELAVGRPGRNVDRALATIHVREHLGLPAADRHPAQIDV